MDGAQSQKVSPSFGQSSSLGGKEQGCLGPVHRGGEADVVKGVARFSPYTCKLPLHVFLSPSLSLYGKPYTKLWLQSCQYCVVKLVSRGIKIQIDLILKFPASV